jgi:sulfur carrier protein
MTVKVNGDVREVPPGETVRALVARFNLKPEKYDTALSPGDEIEIVTFVGGG